MVSLLLITKIPKEQENRIDNHTLVIKNKKSINEYNNAPNFQLEFIGNSNRVLFKNNDAIFYSDASNFSGSRLSRM